MIKKQKFSFIKYKTNSSTMITSSLSKPIADFRPMLALKNQNNNCDSKSEEKSYHGAVSLFLVKNIVHDLYLFLKFDPAVLDRTSELKM